MVSCGWDAVASSSNPWSFTQALIDTLRDLDGSPAILAQIFARLFRRAQQNQVVASPVYVANQHRPSVTLAPTGVQRTLARSTNTRPNSWVLMSVTVRANMPHKPALWTAWLAQNIPSDLVDAHIKVEALCGESCILLISIPVEIWIMLPRDISPTNSSPMSTLLSYLHPNKP